jgi:hypothetical protein
MIHGSQRAISGKAMMIRIRITCTTMNGVAPRKIVASGTSRSIPLITNTFMPIGGVIRPSWTTITMMMPTIPGRSRGR